MEPNLGFNTQSYRGSLEEEKTGSFVKKRSENRRTTLNTTATTLFLDNQTTKQNDKSSLQRKNSRRFNVKTTERKLSINNGEAGDPVSLRKSSIRYKKKRPGKRRSSAMEKIFLSIFQSSGKEEVRQQKSGSLPELSSLNSISNRISSGESNITESNVHMDDFFILTEEIILNIFLQLNFLDLIHLGQTNKKFYQISQDCVLWKNLFQTCFPNIANSYNEEEKEGKINWKERFQNEKYKEDFQRLKAKCHAISENGYKLLYFVIDQSTDSQLTRYDKIKFGFRWFSISTEELIHIIVILYPILAKTERENILKLASEILLVMGLNQISHDVLAQLKIIAKQASEESRIAYNCLTILGGKTLTTSEEKLNEATIHFNNPSRLKSFDDWIKNSCAREAAKELKKLERFYLKQIRGEDIFHFQLNASKEGSPLRNIIKYSNALVYVMISEVLSKDSIKERAKTLEFFIDVIKYLIEIHSYNTAAMLSGGFNQSSIINLQKSRAKINGEHRRTLERNQQLFNFLHNYKDLRALLNEMKQKKLNGQMTEDLLYPVYIHSRDMTFVKDGNADYLENGQLNHDKLELLARHQKEFYEIHQQIVDDYHWETDLIIKIKAMIKKMETESADKIEEDFYNKAMDLEHRT